MKNNDSKEKTRMLLVNHYRTYPKLQVEDIFKYIFQSAFGCEHLVLSEDAVLERIKSEYELAHESRIEIEELDGEYSRVHLSVLDKGLSAETLTRMFLLSAKSEPNAKQSLEEKIEVARELIIEGELPFELEKFDTVLGIWRDNGYPAIHHSQVFREEYHPAYRVIANEQVATLRTLVKIDK